MNQKEEVMPKVEIKHLTKIFGKRRKAALELVKQNVSKDEILKKTGSTVGVYDINLEINDGEIFVIMGLSGSGKSTLIRLLNRLSEPTAGQLIIDGEDITKLTKKELLDIRRKKMSMVFQNFALFPHRTILENTEFGLEVQDISKKERQERAEKALDNAKLLAFKDQYPDQLSGGMQQRVGLARALTNDPDILLMDEAFSALDPMVRKEMQDELLDLQATVQKTIIFITHDLDEALRIGDRIAIMKDGKLVQVGTGEELLTTPENDYVKNFTEGVDRSKVLVAENIMIPAFTTNITVDGPTVALRRMQEEEVSGLVAVNRSRQFQGYLSADAAVRARKQKLPLSEVVEEMPQITSDTLISDILPIIYDANTPVAVVDEGRLRGVIIKGSVLEALADVEDETDDKVETEKEEVSYV